MPEQIAPEGGQEATPAVAPVETPAPPAIPVPAVPPVPPADGPDRDAPRFSQRDIDHIITQRLSEERQRVSKEFEAFKTDVGPQLEEAASLRAAREQAEREALTVTERLQADIAERDRLLAERDGELVTAKAAMQEVRAIQRRDRIDAVLDQTPGLITEQRDRIHRQFADAPEIDPQQVAQAAQTARAEVEAAVRAMGIPVGAVEIGSPGSPPAEPQNDADAEYEDLVTRMENGDDQAAATLQRRFR